MKAPSSRHLSHDFPAYKGLTLRELAGITLVTTISTTVLFVGVGFALGWPVGFGCLGLIVGFIVSVSLVPKPMARRKAGKPHGYLMKILTLTLVRFRLKQSPYLHYKGLWNRCKHV